MRAEVILSSAVLLAVIMLLRFAFRKKLAPSVTYALWLVAALRLLLPVQFGESAVSIANVLPREYSSASVISAGESKFENLQQNNSISENLQIGTPSLPAQPSEFLQKGEISTSSGSVTDKATPLSGTASAEQKQAKREISPVLVIYFAGATAVAFVLCVGNVRFYLKLRRSRVRADISTVSLPVYISKAISAPCLFGLLRPSVYLTEESAAEGKREYILAHELTHYRHLDHIWGYLRLICLVLHWYNPLVWVAAVLSKRDCELACDAGVIKLLGESMRANYARTLIETAETCSRSSVMCSVSTLCDNKRTLKERLSMIVKKQKTAAIILCIVLCISAVAVGCTFTGSKAERAENDKSSAQTNAENKPISGAAMPEDTKNSNEVSSNPLELSSAESNAQAYLPEKVRDIVSAKLVMGSDVYVISEQTKLEQLESLFASAEKLDYAASCPFSYALYLTLESGTALCAFPAEDSCAVIKAGDTYYCYAEDNTVLWELFGVRQSYVDYEYDSFGRAVKKTEYFWKTAGSTVEYEYNAEGYLTKETYTSGDKSVCRETIYEYSDALLARQIIRDKGTNDFIELRYGYDESGRKVSLERLNEKGELSRKELYTWDSSNRLVRCEVYSAVTKRPDYSVQYVYESEREYTELIFDVDEICTSQTHFVCDSVGNPIVKSLCTASGVEEARWEYTYGECDGMRTCKQYSETGALMETWDESYGNAEITRLSITPEDYGITHFDLTSADLPDFSAMNTLKLCVYYLNSDGAYSQGAADEIYTRFIASPADVLCCINYIGNQQLRGTAANQQLCASLVVSGSLMHNAEREFEEVVKKCYEQYTTPEYREIIALIQNLMAQ